MPDTPFLEQPHVIAWCEKQAKYRTMTPEQYQEQLEDLIEYAGQYLSEQDSHAVLTDTFQLLWNRLGVKIDAKIFIPAKGDPQ